MTGPDVRTSTSARCSALSRSASRSSTNTRDLNRGYSPLSVRLARFFLAQATSVVIGDDHQQEHYPGDRSCERSQSTRDLLVVLAQLEPGIGQREIPGDRAGDRRQDEGHDRDPRETGGKGNVGTHHGQQPPDEDREQSPAFEEAVGQPQVAGG